jgi:hypothetical protein
VVRNRFDIPPLSSITAEKHVSQHSDPGECEIVEAAFDFGGRVSPKDTVKWVSNLLGDLHITNDRDVLIGINSISIWTGMDGHP